MKRITASNSRSPSAVGRQEPQDQQSKHLTNLSKINQYRNTYKRFFYQRKPGQVLTDMEKQFILNIFAHMRSSPRYIDLTEVSIYREVADWCSVSQNTVKALVENDGAHEDKRLVSSP